MCRPVLLYLGVGRGLQVPRDHFWAVLVLVTGVDLMSVVLVSTALVSVLVLRTSLVH